MRTMTMVAVLLAALNSGAQAADNHPAQVMDQYFKAVQSHSVENVLAVFAPDAVLETADKEIRGHDKIREFYLNGVLKCTSFTPKPGPYFLIGNEGIAMEITLQCDGVDKRVGDFFTIQNNKITHMRVYSGRGYKPN